jgi:hypothetical protein
MYPTQDTCNLEFLNRISNSLLTGTTYPEEVPLKSLGLSLMPDSLSLLPTLLGSH